MMTSGTSRRSFFVGWDVGGWNCDKNPRSRDAIVVLDEHQKLVGKPWCGNLRSDIFRASTASDWVQRLFRLCDVPWPKRPLVTMAIDAPLGFPEDFLRLIKKEQIVEATERSGENRYLFRQTERLLFEQGHRPLSAVKDMIGSQATKGMHVLSKFATIEQSCGVWTDGEFFWAIETYPAIWRESRLLQEFLEKECSDGRSWEENKDAQDARICAFVAFLFANWRGKLEGPSVDVPISEGWIWAPKLDAEG